MKVRVNFGYLSSEAEAALEVSGFLDSGARFYDDVLTYVMAFIGLVHMIEVGSSGTSAPYAPSDTATFDCARSSASWVWCPREAVLDLASNAVPARLRIERITHANGLPTGPLQLGAVAALLAGYGQVLATNYFERHRPQIEARFGNDPNSAWPGVWNFARVIRNAMSHKGMIHFDNPKATPVSWKGLEYSPRDNGRPVLHTDLWPGDLIDMLIEMDTHLT